PAPTQTHTLSLHDALPISLEATVGATFASAGTMRMGEILRWPGVLVEPELSQEALRDAVMGAAREALNQLLEARRREGAALKARSEEHTSELQSRRDLVCR